MPLFDKPIEEAVTPEDVKLFTGIEATDLGIETEEKLDTLLKAWIKGIGSHMYARLRSQINSADEEYEAIRDILIRTVAKQVAVSQQQRTSPIVQIGDFNIGVLNTSEVIKNLNEELKPFKKRSAAIDIFSSIGEWSGEI